MGEGRAAARAELGWDDCQAGLNTFFPSRCCA